MGAQPTAASARFPRRKGSFFEALQVEDLLYHGLPPFPLPLHRSRPQDAQGTTLQVGHLAKIITSPAVATVLESRVGFVNLPSLRPNSRLLPHHPPCHQQPHRRLLLDRLLQWIINTPSQGKLRPVLRPPLPSAHHLPPKKTDTSHLSRRSSVSASSRLSVPVSGNAIAYAVALAFHLLDRHFGAP